LTEIPLIQTQRCDRQQRRDIGFAKDGFLFFSIGVIIKKMGENVFVVDSVISHTNVLTINAPLVLFVWAANFLSGKIYS
jgi:hypothetical protein